jgi:hypothetical protein
MNSHVYGFTDLKALTNHMASEDGIKIIVAKRGTDPQLREQLATLVAALKEITMTQSGWKAIEIAHAALEKVDECGRV